MSEHLYDAHPSMFRMRPFTTLVVIATLIAGLVIAAFSETLVPPDIAVHLGETGMRIVRWIALGISGLSFLQLLIWWIATRSDRLAITEDEVLWTHGLLSKQYTEIGMASVRTVRIRQSLLQRMMGAGDVSIYTSGDVPELVVKGLPEPSRIRELVKTSPGDEA